PAEQDLTLLPDQLLEELLALVALLHVGRKEDHADAVGARRGQGDLLARRLATQEVVRDLHHDPGTVAGERIAPARAPVGQIAQTLEPLLDDAVRPRALHVDHEADTAGVVLDARVAQPGGGSIRRAHGVSRLT